MVKNKINRALIINSFQTLSNNQLTTIKELEKSFDELIFVVTGTLKVYQPAGLLSAGDRIELLVNILTDQLKKPFFVLPFKNETVMDLQAAYRLKIISPHFDTVICNNQEESTFFEKALNCNTLIADLIDNSNSVYNEINPLLKRGLFITRAQFFHKGHAAHIRKMLSEQDEIIIVIAKANQAFSLENPATAGERIEIIQSYLEQTAKGRYFLAGVPYENYDAENFFMLTKLLPTFQKIYSNNPILKAMAEMFNIPTVALHENINISGTMIRQKIINGEDITSYIPIESLDVLQQSPALQRLKLIATKEKRSKSNNQEIEGLN